MLGMLEQKFDAYIKLEQLTDEVKAKNNIKVGAKTPRFDVTKTAGYYKPLLDLRNIRGMVYFYLNDTRGVINSEEKRRADKFLMSAKHSLNFSSIYLFADMKLGDCYVGFGNPNRNPVYGASDYPNPFFPKYRDDGFVFLIKNDWSAIEVFVVSNGMNLIQGIAKGFCDDVYNEAINAIRTSSTIFYDYKM